LRRTDCLVYECTHMNRLIARIVFSRTVGTLAFCLIAAPMWVRGFDVELTGSNLFDRNYQLYPGFPEAGRIVAVNFKYRY
jgi:hypothetical protein